MKCGTTDHEGKDRDGVARCANCGGGHMASSKECPVWVREKGTENKSRTGLLRTFPEARRLATAATQPATSSATIVKSNILKTTNRTFVPQPILLTRKQT